MSDASLSEASAAKFLPTFDPLRFTKPACLAPAERQRLVAEAAYFRAQKRGFEPGYENEDWLSAEAEVAEELYRRIPAQESAAGK